MIIYSNAKINIGLHILSKRADGFHNLATLMVPVPFYDLMEFQFTGDRHPSLHLTQTGMEVTGDEKQHLCHRAWELFRQQVPVPGLKMHIHKQIPVGAGLGGGSSNAAKTLLALNRLTGETLSAESLHQMAASLGSDCPVFLHPKPMLARGRGEQLQQRSIDMRSWYLVLLHPGFGISTAEAYRHVKPDNSRPALESLLDAPWDRWRETVENDFEASLFPVYPRLAEIKSALYEAGATYAAMSGSGASMYGIFHEKPGLPDELASLRLWEGRPGI